MGKLWKLIRYVLRLPIVIFVNPITSWVVKRTKATGYYFYNNFFVAHSLRKMNCIEHIDARGLTKDSFVLKGHLNLGNNNRIECVLKRGNQVFHPLLEIGDNVIIEDYCHIGCINHISIGDNCLIGSRVFIEDHSHGDFSKGVDDGIKNEKPIYSKGPVIIGKNVWIGEGVFILPNVHIGDNSVIGAGSVVTHDIEANSIYAGNPAKKN